MKSKQQYNRIIVRFPNWLGDIVMAFPFLKEITELNPVAEVVIIVKKGFGDLLKLFPKKVRVIEFDRNHYKGLSGIKNFVKDNKELLRYDVYYTLTPSFSSALMGLLLKSKVRIGYREDLSWLFLNRSKKREKK